MAELRINADALRDLILAVDELSDETEGNDIRLVMGMAMMEEIRDHFSQLAQDTDHHKTSARLGADRTGVYEEAYQGTDPPVVDSDGVSVSIRQVAIAQRFYGGDIDPVSAMWLTIPARAESYGKRAREFEDLAFILYGEGRAALVDKKAGMTEEPFFWLIKHATQPADPTVLPQDEEILDKAVESAVNYLSRVWSNNRLQSA